MHVTYHIWMDYVGERPGEVLEALAAAARRPAATAQVADPVYIDATTVAGIFADDRAGIQSSERRGPDKAVRSAVRRASRFISSGGRDVVGTAEHPFNPELLTPPDAGESSWFQQSFGLSRAFLTPTLSKRISAWPAIRR